MPPSHNFDKSHLFDVSNLVAVVTGGSSGIGLLMALALEANGAIVYITGRRSDRLQTATKQATHGNLIPLVGNVTSPSDLSRITSTIAGKTGYINLLLANAGISGPTIPSIPLGASTESVASLLQSIGSSSSSADDITNVLATNFTGTYLTITSFLPLLAAGNAAIANKDGGSGGVPILKQSSQIIATSSICGFNRLAPSGFAYAASKAGLTHMMKQFSTLLAGRDGGGAGAGMGVRCNVLAPGVFPSEMLDKERFGRAIDRKEIPEGRMGDAEDIAGAILFMASRAGAYCNGNVLVLDGGRLSVMPATY